MRKTAIPVPSSSRHVAITINSVELFPVIGRSSEDVAAFPCGRVRAISRLSAVVVTTAEARVDVVVATAAGGTVLVVVVTAASAGTVLLVVAATDQRAYRVTSVSPVCV